MHIADPVDKLKRRSLQFGFGAALVLPFVSAASEKVFFGPASVPAITYRLFQKLADDIIPLTSSPSATQVGADTFALNVVLLAKSQHFKTDFFAGVQAFVDDFGKAHDAAYTESSAQDRLNFLTRVLKDNAAPGHNFLSQYRRFLITGWVVSREVATQTLNYTPIPGSYNPRTSNSRYTMPGRLSRVRF